MPVELSDADLAQRIAAGAVRRSRKCAAGWRRVFGCMACVTCDRPSAADDLVQLVLLKVIEALRAGRLREPDKLAHVRAGHVSDDRARSAAQPRAGRNSCSNVRGNPGARLSRRYLSLDDTLLARCVQALKERERSVVVMTFYDEQAAAETARFLGISEANVRVIRHRAIQQLRVCMGAHGDSAVQRWPYRVSESPRGGAPHGLLARRSVVRC